MSLNNGRGGGGGGGVFARDAHNRFVSTSFDDDALYSPEMDDMLDDRLEEARQNRTNYYRKMLASRSRPLDDYSVSKRVTYRSGNSPAKEPSISDTVPAGPLPQIPEPHSSWRFYTSYDNGEWKRHAVPVHKEEEEILRQPTKSLRRLRETERSTESPPVESSSLRRMRQSGGPLVACLQPRPRRTSEGQKTSTTVHMVNGQPMVSGGGGGGGAEFVGQFGLPADWADLCGNGAVVRRFSDGGTEYLVLEQEPVQGTVKQEHTTKYTSTVKVTQPNRSLVKQVVSGEQAAGGGGVEEGQGTAGGESGERKSRRPRIYGFQEKIIIPTKYKNAENQEPSGEEKSSTDINTGQPVSSRNTGTRVETTVTKGPSVEDGLMAKERRVGGGREVGGRSVVQTTETSRSGVSGGDHQLKIGSVALDRPVQGKTVKVVVVNSGSDVESSDKKSVELLSSEEEKDALETFPARQLNAGIIQLPNLFQDGAFPIEGIKALHESFHASLLPTASPSKDRAGSVSISEDSAALIPNQRVFSKDEQTFSEVGPDGAKCDGKVLRTYEVITTTNEEDSTVQNKQLSPTTMVNQQLSPPMEVTVVPVDREERSSFRTSSISSTGENNSATKPEAAERILGSHFSQQEIRSPSRETTSVVSRKTDDRKSPDIFEQTGSLFKTITPRPRHVREKESVFAAREEHLRKAAGESAQPKSGGITSKTIRISANQLDGFKREPEADEKASSNVGAAETVRTTVKHVLSRNHSLRQRDPPAPAEEELPVRRGLAAFETEDSGSSVRSNTNSGVRSQAWGDTTQADTANLNTRGTDKEWEIQVALKE